MVSGDCETCKNVNLHPDVGSIVSKSDIPAEISILLST